MTTSTLSAHAPVATTGRLPLGYLLVVDEEPLVRSSLRRVLGGQHAVTCSKTFAEALALVVGGMRFDLILCNLVAPGRAGKALYDELLRQEPEQARRVVFLTGGAFPPRMVEFLASVPNRRIGQPSDVHELRGLVNELLTDLGPIAGETGADGAPKSAVGR